MNNSYVGLWESKGLIKVIVLDIIKFIMFLNIIKVLDITVRKMFIGFRSSNINNPKWLDIQRNLNFRSFRNSRVVS